MQGNASPPKEEPGGRWGVGLDWMANERKGDCAPVENVALTSSAARLRRSRGEPDRMVNERKGG